MTAARKTDPISSHLAANEVSEQGIKLEQQRATLLALYFYERIEGEPATCSELASDRALMKWGRYSHDPEAHAALVKGEINTLKAQYYRRLPELGKEGLVHVKEIRRCRIGNRVSQVWQLTDLGRAAAEIYADL